MQSTLWNAHGIKTVRRTLADVAAMGKLEADGTLRIGTDLVSVVYFRAGCVLLRGVTTSSGLRSCESTSYTPADYPSETEWEGRSIIERSAAAKCPSIGCVCMLALIVCIVRADPQHCCSWHLAGAKKVQQELAQPVRTQTQSAPSAFMTRLHARRVL